jgi:hypothetical protein
MFAALIAMGTGVAWPYSRGGACALGVAGWGRLEERLRDGCSSCAAVAADRVAAFDFIGNSNVAETSRFGLAKLTGKSTKRWSGRRESNPRMQLGKLPFYH